MFLNCNFLVSNERMQRGRSFCNTNPIDNGIAVTNEFPHMAIIEGKISTTFAKFKIMKIDTKCAGSLISTSLVLTSNLCVNSTRHSAANIKFGVLIFNSTDSEESYEINKNDILTENQLTILKLPELMEVSEFLIPTNVATLSFDTLSAEKLVLAGWTGYRYECNQQMRKWLIRKTHFKLCKSDIICLSETDIINYREASAVFVR